MSLRDILSGAPLQRLLDRRRAAERRTPTIAANGATVYDAVLREIALLPEDWHGAGVCGAPPLLAMASHAPSTVLHSAETGCGKSTLLLSHVSQHHVVFTIDDTGTNNSLSRVKGSPLLRAKAVEFVLGPTQRTLPSHAFPEKLQLVLIDGPHGFPFPELEYYFFYPHLDQGALLILDDIHIPTIFRLFSFLRDEDMFDFLGVAYMTAFFRRNATPLFDPLCDGWWLQKYNKKRFAVSNLDEDLLPASLSHSAEFERVMRQFGHWPTNDQK